jgi:hypothetical protein
VSTVATGLLLFDLLIRCIAEKNISQSINEFFTSHSLLTHEERGAEVKRILQETPDSIYKGTGPTISPVEVLQLSSNRDYEKATCEFFRQYVSSEQFSSPPSAGAGAGQVSSNANANARPTPQQQSDQTAQSQSHKATTKKTKRPKTMDELNKYLVDRIFMTIEFIASLRARFIYRAKEGDKKDTRT